MPRVTVQPRDVLYLARVTPAPRPDLSLRAIDLDVAGLSAGIWLAGIGTADVGDFEHHVSLPVFIPEGDANVRSAVTWH